MGYELALGKAWEKFSKSSIPSPLSIKFLADEYEIDFKAKRVFSLACNAPAKDFTAILILHYLASRLQGLPELSGEWFSFKELSGIEGYGPTFRKRVVEPVLRKYGNNPDGLLAVLERMPGKRVAEGDVGIVLEAFERVPVKVLVWRADEEFGPEANVLFDKSVTGIFCTEDIVVLAGIVAAGL